MPQQKNHPIKDKMAAVALVVAGLTYSGCTPAYASNFPDQEYSQYPTQQAYYPHGTPAVTSYASYNYVAPSVLHTALTPEEYEIWTESLHNVGPDILGQFQAFLGFYPYQTKPFIQHIKTLNEQHDIQGNAVTFDTVGHALINSGAVHMGKSFLLEPYMTQKFLAEFNMYPYFHPANINLFSRRLSHFQVYWNLRMIELAMQEGRSEGQPLHVDGIMGEATSKAFEIFLITKETDYIFGTQR